MHIETQEIGKSPDSFSVDLLKALGISVKHCKRAVIYLEANSEPVIDVTYSLSHVPTFKTIEEFTKHYAIVDLKSKVYGD